MKLKCDYRFPCTLLVLSYLSHHTEGTEKTAWPVKLAIYIAHSCKASLFLYYSPSPPQRTGLQFFQKRASLPRDLHCCKSTLKDAAFASNEPCPSVALSSKAQMAFIAWPCQNISAASLTLLSLSDSWGGRAHFLHTYAVCVMRGLTAAAHCSPGKAEKAHFHISQIFK